MTGFTEAMVPEIVQPFWAAVQRGEFITDAAGMAGTYRKKGARWIAAAGGVRPRRGRNLKGRCLSFAEREEIALARAAGASVRRIAERIGRSPSAVSRELRRNGGSPAEDAQIPVTADAALFCAVHDILQSPDALRNVMTKLRPGAPVAAGGGKWAARWMVGVNLHARMLHAPYVRSFEGFGRPWNHLEPLLEDVHIREVALGSGYIVTGQAPRTRS